MVDLTQGRLDHLQHMRELRDAHLVVVYPAHAELARAREQRFGVDVSAHAGAGMVGRPASPYTIFDGLAEGRARAVALIDV